ncbi:hypothetical protein DY000_02004513 [Brassica cretica]|uniref:DEAD-box RNA helicase Q domain-containing protein n=1 Tax=Brassica cretica TaxID=69181 RepID=A0ABQ7C718_BRACR|nr:hypothetical protein DY000_02004513 [Brassica cretica]
MATTGNKNINAKLTYLFHYLFDRYDSRCYFPLVSANNIFNTIAKLGFTEPTPIQAQGWPMALKGEEPVSLTKRRFRSKNIEPIPFWKMQLVPFNGKLVKAKKRCHWCGTRGCEDLRALVFLIRV